MELDEKTLDQIRTAVGKTVEPIAQEARQAVSALEEKLRAEIKSAVDGVRGQVEAARPDPARVDSDGKSFDPTKGPGGRRAPAFIRPEGLGDRPLMLVDVARLFRDHDERAVPLLMHVSSELQKLGYTRTLSTRSVMFPLTPMVLDDEGNQVADNLRKLLRDAMPVEEDFAASRALIKQWLPQIVSKQMDPNDDTLGGSLVPLPPTGDLIELFRAVTVMGKVGAEQITLPPQGSIRWPKETGATTFYWLDSNQTITDSTVATGSLQLTAKRLGGLIKVPNDLIRYGMNVEGLLRRSLVADAGLAEDLAFLEGVGGGTTPLGILRHGRSADDTPTDDLVTLHNAATVAANGDTFGIADPTDMIALVETANDADGPTAFVMRPMMLAAIANRRVDQGSGDGTGAFAFPDVGTMADRYQKRLRGLPVVTSTQVNKTSRKGSGTNLTYIMCCNGRRYVVGRVGAVELAASEHAGFAADQIWLRAILRVDGAMKKPQSFCLTPVLLEQ